MGGAYGKGYVKALKQYIYPLYLKNNRNKLKLLWLLTLILFKREV